MTDLQRDRAGDDILCYEHTPVSVYGMAYMMMQDGASRARRELVNSYRFTQSYCPSASEKAM